MFRGIGLLPELKISEAKAKKTPAAMRK